MSRDINPNASAYPLVVYEGRMLMEGGLTKREHFAGLAMQAMLRDPEMHQKIHNTDEIVAFHEMHLAVNCADALLQELNK